MVYREGSEGRNILVAATGGWVRGRDRRTGERVWEVNVAHSGGSFATYHEAIELIVREDVVLAAALMDKSLYCIEYQTGAVIGRVDLGTIGRKSILVDGNQIFVGCGREIRCYDLHGNSLWEDLGDKGAGVVSLGLPGNVRQADQT